MLELNDLMVGVHALAVADSLVNSLGAMFSAGMPNGADPGALAAGGAAAGAASAAAGTVGAHGPPNPPWRSMLDRQLNYYRYRDSAGNGYWPGISAIPEDGIVYQREGRFNNDLERKARGGGWNPHSLPVDGDTGRVIHPPPPPLSDERVTASLTSAGRG